MESIEQQAALAGLCLRNADSADAPAIAEIYNFYVRRRGSSFDLEEKSAAQIAAQIEALAGNECLLVLEALGACGQDSLVGYGRLEHYSPRLGYRCTGETALYVRDDQLRRGYGSLLKRALIERARDLGYHHLVAKIVADNTASIELNQRFGYSLVGTQREVGLIDGHWRDVTIMQLILQSDH